VSGPATTKHLFAGALRIAALSQEGIAYLHSDHLGSAHVTTDAHGVVASLTEYAPFGTLASGALPESSVGFTGQRFDESTALYFYHARYYDPSLGRFIQPDILVQAPGDPQTLNRYSYARNNPVRFVDPSGLVTQEALIYAALMIGLMGFENPIFFVVAAVVFGLSFLFRKGGSDRRPGGDTGFRLLAGRTLPTAPQGNFQQPLQATFSGRRGGALGFSAEQLGSLARQALLPFGIAPAAAAVLMRALDPRSVAAMMDFVEPHAPTLVKNLWEAGAGRVIDILSQTRRVVTHTFVMFGATRAGVFAGALELQEVSRPFSFFRHATNVLAVVLLTAELAVTAGSSLSAREKTARGAIQIGAVGASLLTGVAIASFLFPPGTPITFGLAVTGTALVGGAGFSIDRLKNFFLEKFGLQLP